MVWAILFWLGYKKLKNLDYKANPSKHIKLKFARGDMPFLKWNRGPGTPVPS